jgi:glycosyltransferase involved in cell wall biosynthesis
MAADGETLKERLAAARVDPEAYRLVASAIDPSFYRAQFEPGEEMPDDCAIHYLTIGWAQGRDPVPDFSTSLYLRLNPDVARAGVNPFFHHIARGGAERRRSRPSRRARDGGPSAGAVFAAHAESVAPGTEFEPFDARIARGREPDVKALAFYLPQFHPIPENDAAWGEGFTEWRNTARAMPRFAGHRQPRIPSALGFYDLRDAEVLARQAALAKSAGVHGFVFYYYAFDGRRVLERPIDTFLASNIDFPFAVMWANENWTRRWDGHDEDVILRQSYRPEDEPWLLADIARHLCDPRAITLGGRPVFFLYRPGIVPDAAATFRRWRAILATDHGVEPLLFMAQVFRDNDPRPYGLDGAIEFPPHKLCQDLATINDELALLDPGFTGMVHDYGAVVARSLDEAPAAFPLIKTAVPGWDNEPRRPGRGTALHGATPRAFEGWVRALAARAAETPVAGEAVIAVNAWNEWAESAVLEPCVHYGAAFLNALARGVTGAPAAGDLDRRRVVLVGHDAGPHGAQLLLLRLAETLTRRFGMMVEIVLLGAGPLVPAFEAFGPTTVLPRDGGALVARFRQLRALGYGRAILNTTVSGHAVAAAKRAGLATVVLVHELPSVIESFGLAAAAKSVARFADHVVFPAPLVAERFESVAGRVRGAVTIEPQGLYLESVLAAGRTGAIRARFGIPPAAKLVVNVGFADLRKAPDIFVAVAERVAARRDDVHFLWVGAEAPDAARWIFPEAEAGALAGRLHRTRAFLDDPSAIYGDADLLFVSSREDPYPSTVLEALGAGLPIVVRAGATGCEALAARYGRVAGADADAAATALLDALDADDDAARAARKAHVRAECRFADYAFGLLRRLDEHLAGVTAAIPNYNYARYLEARLSDVFRQDLPLYEVLLLDDASTDDSLAVVERFAEASGRAVRIVPNRVNSGSVFVQWRRAAELATSPYLWIAEADDLARPGLVSSLLRRMREADAGLGFSDSWANSRTDRTLAETYRGSLRRFHGEAFDRPFALDGRTFAARHLAVENVIFNASAVLWRRDDLLAALDGAADDLGRLSLAGDWRLYLEHALRGGGVVYDPAPLNGHRRHDVSVTHRLDPVRHLGEITAMQALAAERLGLDAATRARQAAYRDFIAAILEAGPLPA